MGKYDRNAPATDIPEEPAPEPRRPVGEPKQNKYSRAQTEAADRMVREQSSMGWPAWLNEAAGDFTASSADAASFGTRPRLDAATGNYPDYSTGLAAELQKVQQRTARSPFATMGGNVAGSVTVGIASGLNRIGTNIAGRMGGGPMARILGFGTEGAVGGALQGAGHTYSGEVDDYLKNTGTGAAVGAVVGGTVGSVVPRQSVTMRPGDPNTGRPIPVVPEQRLQEIVDRGYQIFRGIPATYSSRGFNAHLTAAEQDMIKAGAMPSTARPVYDVLENLRTGQYGFANAAGDIGPQQIETARQALNNLRNTTDASAKAGTAARILRGQLEDFVQYPGANITGSRDAALRAAQVIEKARGNAAALFRSKQLTDPVANARLAAETGGAPVGEQLVTQGRRILQTKGGTQPKTRGWVDAEREQLAEAITPTMPERAIGLAGAGGGKVAAAVGGLLGGTGGGVAGIPAGLGGVVGGGTLGAAAGSAAGMGLGTAARNTAARGIENRWLGAAEAMRARSPYQQRQFQGSTPVAGPGQGLAGQAALGGGTFQLGTPYDDGRAAVAEQMLRNMMP
jgi:hypothetical protein